ncbi:MAG: hypothetical protein WCF85_21840 [Rhodospirillaceae bacterium]
MASILASSLFCGTEVALADPFVPPSGLPVPASGKVWFVGLDANGFYDATFANIPTATPDVTFSASAIGFTTYGPGKAYPWWTTPTPGDVTNSGDAGHLNTISGFLTSLGEAYKITYAPGILGNHALLDPFFVGTFIEITGKLNLVTGEKVGFAHDDGVGFALNGIDYSYLLNNHNASGVVETITYTGPDGLINFDLVYSEVRSLPGYLEMHVSEPNAIWLLTIGLLAVAMITRRRLHELSARHLPSTQF